MPGKQQARTILAIIIALVIGGILIGNLLPVGINAVNQDDTYNLVQDNQTTYAVIDGTLNSTVTDVETAGATDNATIRLTDVDTGESVTQTVDNQSSSQYNLAGGNVNVTVNDVTSGSPDTVDITYSVPPDYGWEDSSKSIWNLIPLLFVLVPLAVVAGWAMKAL